MRRLLLAMPLCLGTSILSAQDSVPPASEVNASGLFLAAHPVLAPGLSIGGPTFDQAGAGKFKTETGFGLGVMIGYAQRPITFYVGLDFAVQAGDNPGDDADYGLGHVEIGARFHLLRAGTRIAPYLNVTSGVRALAAGDVVTEDGTTDISLTGGYVGIGGGILYYLSPKVALDGSIAFAIGKFDRQEAFDVTEDVDLDYTLSPRVKIGLAWYPVRSRRPPSD